MIEHRGEPVDVNPISAPLRLPDAKKAEIFASVQAIWDRMPTVSDSTTILEEDRDR